MPVVKQVESESSEEEVKPEMVEVGTSPIKFEQVAEPVA
jgi:hypothetical protein